MSKDIWKDAFEADWGIAQNKKNTVIPAVNAGKLTGPVMRFFDESYLGYFHTRPMASLFLWVIATVVLLLDFDSGYWVLSLFLIFFTLIRGAIGIKEKAPTDAEDAIHGRVYAFFIIILGLGFGVSGFAVLTLAAFLDGFLSLILSDRLGRRGHKSKKERAPEIDDPLFVVGRDSPIGSGYFIGPTSDR